jgi:hypothetical protein
MLTKFWDKLSEELAGQWSVQELGPALVFWFGGLLAWAWRNQYLGSWAQLTGWLAGLDSPVAYAALLLGGLLLLAALDDMAPGQRTPEQEHEYALLDARRARYPADVRYVMPTPLGNLLRTAEEYPLVRYGLAIGVCWPRLWLLLPKETQEALSAARQSLNSAARLFFWGLLFAVWTAWAWWATLAALGMLVVAYWAMVQAAGVYGDLLRAAFDLHRFALYEALRLPAPAGPDHEEADGQQLSEYLFRGTIQQDLRFVVPDK